MTVITLFQRVPVTLMNNITDHCNSNYSSNNEYWYSSNEPLSQVFPFPRLGGLILNWLFSANRPDIVLAWVFGVGLLAAQQARFPVLCGLGFWSLGGSGFRVQVVRFG